MEYWSTGVLHQTHFSITPITPVFRCSITPIVSKETLCGNATGR
jgi:hypothetical protein